MGCHLMEKKTDPRVLESLLTNLVKTLTGPPTRKLLDLVVSMTGMVDMQADLRLECLNVSFISLGDLLRKFAEFDLLDWVGRVKLVDCICSFISLKPQIGQTMVEKLLVMLQDPDYGVRLNLARRIGVLFQTLDGHAELFLDICSNFGENEKMELEAVFIMCAIAAIDPCQSNPSLRVAYIDEVEEKEGENIQKVYYSVLIKAVENLDQEIYRIKLPGSAKIGGSSDHRYESGSLMEGCLSEHRFSNSKWISVGSDLKFDARRDLDDVGAIFIKVHALNKLAYSKLDVKAVGVREGVVFLTYSSLIASSTNGRSRLKQLVQWCGKDYDGLIVFDECHKAKNLVPEAGVQPTRTCQAVLEIQAMLPEARVVYCSATIASEPRNMGYRPGLWRTGTSFLDFRDFIGSLEKGGVGALELVAMDLKARGMYLCRTLSYIGAKIDVVEVPLEDKMMRFFKHMSLVKPRTEEAVAKCGIELVDFISGPRELLLKKIIHCLENLNLCQVRTGKSVKYQEESDTESEIDSEPEPADSDDEFQICQICNSEAERKKLLQCSCCKQLMHPAYSVLPVTGSVSADWSCLSCKEKTEEYLQQRRVYLAQKLERYDKATERKSHILDLIHSLELPLDPLDDIIVQIYQ
ncbi:hypothetical protein POM88_006964 [Heracleum sosnowskyi]|uniref:Strawberry notch AAA domain-containing protein n=1 Tax=Heracleum sosnowskyi TaxID=360622 RepID=A0AAD8J4J0_9APIA|nr:hypothetical protein POM88_006964 [Heracleum sosnowskyi]